MTTLESIVSRRRRWLARAILYALAFTVPLRAPAHAAKVGEQHFASAQEAAQALVDGLKASDKKAVLGVLGPAGERLISSGDPVADTNASASFVQDYDEAHSLVNTNDTTATLQIGKADWPFPIPLIKEEAGWRFDTAAGAQEIINRRIGRNELSAIQVCLAYVDAQREYYTRNPEGSALLHYAQKIPSTQGKRDGLYWKTAAGEEQSPLGEFVGKAQAEGYARGKGGKPVPHHGYYYRILTAQGPDAPGGAYDYVAHGKMIGGFALLAYPATYDSSGVMTFMVNHGGVVFQKDLGPKTTAIASATKTFNPDGSWKRVEETSLVRQ